MRGLVCQMAFGSEKLESSGQIESVDSLSNDSFCGEATPLSDSEFGEPTTFDESVPARLLLETPNIRLFEIGVDEVYGYANYGWAETSDGSWGAGGDASNYQAGGKSLWVMLSASQSASLRTANGWMIVSVDGHETQVCLAHEIEYLHVHGDGNTIDMTSLETEILSTNLLIDWNGETGNGTLISRADADCLFIGDGNSLFFLGEENAAINAASFVSAEFADDLTTNDTAVIDADRSVAMEILDSLFCDVAFIDTAKLGGGCDMASVEKESLVTADHTIAEDETLTEPRRRGPTRPRIRRGMELNL